MFITTKRNGYKLLAMCNEKIGPMSGYGYQSIFLFPVRSILY